MSNQDITKNASEDTSRYNNDSPDQQQDTERYASSEKTNSESNNKNNTAPENAGLAADLTTMVENINTDLTNLYQEINQHINEQLDQVKASSHDIQSLMSNLNQQLKNSQKK